MEQGLKALLDSRQLFIFDFDGTLADTETLQFESYSQVLAEYGVPLTSQMFKEHCIGNIEINIYTWVSREFGVNIDMTVTPAKRAVILFKLMQDVKPYAYLMDIFVRYAVEKSFVILTANHEHVVRKVLEDWGMSSIFSKVVSTGTGLLTKAAVLENTKRYFGYEGNESVIFEDDSRHLKSGLDNNLIAIALTHELNQDRLKDYTYRIEDPNKSLLEVL